MLFENSKNPEISAIGTAFATAWNNLSQDQQLQIRKQTQLMRSKRYAMKPHLINYFSAIVNALTIEQTDAATFSSYLAASGKVIENLPLAKALSFFTFSNSFFQHHALHYERSVKLYATDDVYTFDYIGAPVPIDLSDTTTQSQPTETPLEELPDDTFPADDQPVDPPVSEEFVPAWMTPAPPPYIEGPILKFDKISLNFVTPYDSVFLKNSKGTLSITDKIFVGENGTFDWATAGLHPDSVYCNFTTYTLKVNSSEFKVDLVKLNYTGKTPGLIPGSFEFKSQPRKDSVIASYPRFKSYQSNLAIQGLADKNVTYSGGFSLTGDKISSTAFNGEPSVIEVFHNNTKKFIARSSDFIFTDSTIVAEKTSLKILHGSDSIAHPMVRMKYTFGDSTQQLLVMKDKGIMRNTPYSSTFFNIDFAVDIIRWDLNADSLNMLTDGGRNTVPLIIESVDYYDSEDYRLLNGVGFSFHPLGIVVSYVLKKRIREFYSGDLANYAKKSPEEIKRAVEFLAQKGLVSYNYRTDLIQVKQKAVDLYKAHKGELDYDNLKIHSIIDSTANSTLNFTEGYMTIRGVEEFNVSDSLHVNIKPDSSIITLLRNRDIKFNGTINAGNFEISGKDFTLRYDSFNIDLKHIDSINFYVSEKNAKGQEVRRKINNSMVGTDSVAASAAGLSNASNTSGTLFISKPNNKSGKRKIPNYPRLDASAGGVIYFDRDEVLDRAYDKSIFFVVPPFKLDSLNDTDPASINFNGTFVSNGMFPNFKENLHTQPDKSLGFTHAIPQPGYQLYRSDAKLNGTLTMNNQGLRSNGQIDYLAASVRSSDFIFYPDSVIAKGNSAKIAKQQHGSVLFPQASLTNYEMKWYPKEDKMQFKNVKTPFNFYDSTAQMRGTVIVTKNGVKGSGKFETRGTELISRDMDFTGDDFGARHARFKVKTADPDKPLLSGDDIRVKFNLNENYADISPEIAGVAAVNFPFAQFKTSIPKARWNIDAQTITMSKDPEVPLENSYFYTTRKDLDSLRFSAEKAEYNLKTQELKVSGIPYIIVADAKITPENNEVLILENAKIGTLTNTTIILDTLNGYHRLTEGVVDIISRKEFGGHATYQYVNLLNDTFAIKMTDFHLEPIVEVEGSKRSQRKNTGASLQTVATGAVLDKDNLVLGAGLYYKGDMIMYATRPALQLTGFVKLAIKNIPDYDAWLRYSQTGDETEVQLDFDNAITEDGRRATAGIHFSTLDSDLYITLINDKKAIEDDDFFIPSGMLVYDKNKSEYIIEDKEKAAGNKLSGKVFAYNDEKRHLRFEGPVNIFNGGKSFNITSSVIGTANLETSEYRMNSLVLMDSNVPSNAFDVMARNLQHVIKNEGASEGLGDHTELLYKIADLVGERTVKDYEQKSLKGYVSLGTIPQLIKPIVFSDVNLKWHPKIKAFYSEGNIGISNINKHDINGGFEGFMEIKKTEDGSSVFNIFFKASPEAWYYFGFEDSRLLVHSSNSDFNDIISKKATGGKTKVGEVAFIPGTDDEALAFINRFRQEYYGIEVPYSLSEGSQAAEKKTEEKKKEEDDGF
jgi:hypothetical protein